MLPKRQAVKQDQGPPKYQPPPQVNNKTGGAQPFAAGPNKDGPRFTLEVNGVHLQVDGRKSAPPAVPMTMVNGNGGGEQVAPPKEDTGRPLSPHRGLIENNVILRTVRLPGEEVRSTWRPSSDEELLQRSSLEILRVLRSAEAEMARLASEHNLFVRDARTRLQTSAGELRNTQELVRRLQDDNQELRDLCCFLDDDRQKGRKLAREWQRFGRYTASVMRQEVSAYQGKLRELDSRQHELIRDNLELKELCLYLDEERGNHGSCTSCGASLRPGPRDDGDGSSSSTNADEPVPPPAPAPAAPFIPHPDSRERLMEDSIQRQRNAFNDQLVGYIRSLEHRVAQLEDERRVLQQRLLQSPASEQPPANVRNSGPVPLPDPASRPEAVVYALQVLHVREQLERVPSGSQGPPNLLPLPTVTQPVLAELAMAASAGGQAELDDGEKALVREMCNVVWRKLEEAPPNARR